VLALGQSDTDAASLADTTSEDDADQDSLDDQNEPQVPILWKLLGIDIRKLRGFLPNQCPTPDSQTKQSSGSQSGTTVSTTKSLAMSTGISSVSNQVLINDNQALDENSVAVAVESKPREPEYGPRKLVCHLAAYGIAPCPKKTYKSTRAYLILKYVSRHWTQMSHWIESGLTSVVTISALIRTTPRKLLSRVIIDNPTLAQDAISPSSAIEIKSNTNQYCNPYIIHVCHLQNMIRSMMLSSGKACAGTRIKSSKLPSIVKQI
jgi:hypothetical protein